MSEYVAMCFTLMCTEITSENTWLYRPSFLQLDILWRHAGHVTTVYLISTLVPLPYYDGVRNVIMLANPQTTPTMIMSTPQPNTPAYNSNEFFPQHNVGRKLMEEPSLSFN